MLSLKGPLRLPDTHGMLLHLPQQELMGQSGFLEPWTGHTGLTFRQCLLDLLRICRQVEVGVESLQVPDRTAAPGHAEALDEQICGNMPVIIQLVHHGDHMVTATTTSHFRERPPVTQKQDP